MLRHLILTAMLAMSCMLVSQQIAAQSPAAPHLSNESRTAPIFFDEDQERIESILATRNEWNFGIASISKVAGILRQRFQMDVEIDSEVLHTSNIPLDTPIAWPSGNNSLERVLRQGLLPHGMDLYVGENSISISSATTGCHDFLQTRLYPVADLTRPDSLDQDVKSLMSVVQQCTSGQWEEPDGVGGSMTYVPIVQGLIVRQTRLVHPEVEQTLKMLRRAKAAQAAVTRPDTAK